MIKLKDILNEAKVHRLQIFTQGTGRKGAGNFKFNQSKITTAKLRIFVSNKFKFKPKPSEASIRGNVIVQPITVELSNHPVHLHLIEIELEQNPFGSQFVASLFLLNHLLLQ